MEVVAYNDLSINELKKPSERLIQNPSLYCSKIDNVLFPNSTFKKYSKKFKDIYPDQVCEKISGLKDIYVRCMDCQINESSCVCLQCFRSGNHENHTYFAEILSSATCDCGKPVWWKSSGFCPKHGHNISNPDLEQLTPFQNEIYHISFRAMLNSFSWLGKKILEGKKIEVYVKWIDKHIGVCDGIRRIYAEELFNSDLEKIMRRFIVANTSIVSTFVHTINMSMNDEKYDTILGGKLFSIMPSIVDHVVKLAQDETRVNLKKHTKLLIGQKGACWISDYQILLKNKSFPWVDIALALAQRFINLNLQEERFPFRASYIYYINKSFFEFIPEAAKIPELIPEVRRFLTEYSKILAEIEGRHPFYRNLDDKMDDDFTSDYQVDVIISQLDIVSLRSKEVFAPGVFEVYGNWLKENPANQSDDVFSSYFAIPILIPLHVIVYMNMLNSDSYEASFKKLMKITGLSNYDLCVRVADTPLSFLIAYYMNAHDFYVRNDNIFIFRMRSMAFKCGISIYLMPLFGLVQAAAGFCEDQERFIQYIAKKCGLLDDHSDEDDVFLCAAELTFLFIVFCIAFDRVSNRGNIHEAELASIGVAVMTEEKVDLTDLWKYSTDQYTFAHKEKVAELREFCERQMIGKSSILKCKDFTKFSVFLPWFQPNKIQNAFDQYSQINKGKILPLKIPRNPNGLSLLRYLQSPTLLAVCYRALCNVANEKPQSFEITANIVSYFLSSQKPKKYPQPSKLIVVDTLQELIKEMPNSIAEFLVTPIDIGFGKNSVGQLLSKIGKQCGTVAEILGIADVEKVPKIVKGEDAKKAAAAALKAKIMAEFKDKQKMVSLEESEGEYSETMDTFCSICLSSDPLLCHPCLVMKTVIPSIIDGKPIQCSRILQICEHYVHRSCIDVSKNDNYYICPMDRCARNIFIPDMQCNFKDIPSSLIKAEASLNWAFDPTSSGNLMRNTVRGVAGMIIMMEARQRGNPAGLEGSTHYTEISFPTAFLWAKNKIMEKSKKDSLSNIKARNPTEQLVINFASSANPLSEIDSIIKKISEGLDGVELLAFLRRAEIFREFAKGTQSSPKVNWTELLSTEFLTAKYKISKSVPQKLVPLTFNLAKSFAENIPLNLPPYAYEYFDDESESQLLLDLFTGAVVKSAEWDSYPPKFSKFIKGIPNVWEYLKKHMYDSYSVFLLITGKNAGQIWVYSGQLEVSGMCFNVFENLFGLPVTLGDMEPMTLSVGRLTDAVDGILSSGWVNIVIDEDT